MAEPLLSSTKSLVVALPEVRVPMTVARPASSSAAAAASATPAVPLVGQHRHQDVLQAQPALRCNPVRPVDLQVDLIRYQVTEVQKLACHQSGRLGRAAGIGTKVQDQGQHTEPFESFQGLRDLVASVFQKLSDADIPDASGVRLGCDGRAVNPGCMAQLENRDSHNGGSPAGLPRGVHPERALSG